MNNLNLGMQTIVLTLHTNQQGTWDGAILSQSRGHEDKKRAFMGYSNPHDLIGKMNNELIADKKCYLCGHPGGCANE